MYRLRYSAAPKCTQYHRIIRGLGFWLKTSAYFVQRFRHILSRCGSWVLHHMFRSGEARFSGRRHCGKRCFPCLAFVAVVTQRGNMQLELYGTVILIGIYLAGYSREERLQHAAKSWLQIDTSITTVELCPGVLFDDPFLSSSADLWFMNQSAELTPACFARLQLAYPELLHGRTAATVPILLFRSKLHGDLR